ncbi:serine--tRNA ligase, partial [Gammaproteobacteria bacterium]|nr:serine--tRNA ligase [Gammaproteobacteria bacterium]
MIDPKLIRHETQIVLDSLSKRKNDFELDDYLLAEEASRKIQTEVENLRSTKNKLTKKIGSSQLDEKAKGKIVDEVHEINDSLKDSEAKLEGLSVEVRDLSLQLPNILHESVPEGNDENDNVVIRERGKIREFSFEPKDHTQLGEESGRIDFQSASKISGSRFAVIIDRYA